MSKRASARNAYVMFLRDLHGILSTKDPKKIRERALTTVEGALQIIEHLAPETPKARLALIESIRDILDRSPCEDFQQLLRNSLRRLQGAKA